MKICWLLRVLVLGVGLSFGLSVATAQTRNTSQEAQAQATNLRQIALEFYSNRQFDKAIELLQQLYDQDPSQTNYYYLISSYLQVKDYKQAEKLVKNQIKVNKGGASARYYCDLGYVYSNSGETKKAEQEFSNAINSMKANESDIYGVANAFVSYGMYDRAVEAYKQGEKLMKIVGRFDSDLAYLYDLLGDTQQMVELYLDYISTDVGRINNIKYRLQNSMNKESSTTSSILRTALLNRLQKDPGNVPYAELLLWHSIEQQDFDMAIKQAISLDQRLNENGTRLLNIALTAFTAEDYANAMKAANYVLQKVDTPMLLKATTVKLKSAEMLLNRKAKDYGVQLEGIRNEYINIIDNKGYTVETAELIADYAQLEMVRFKNMAKGIEVLEKLVAVPGLNAATKAQYKLQLADIYLADEDPWEASLLYSQVERSMKNEPIGHEAKFKNAKLLFFKGEFDWAKAQADVLKEATSKLIANDAMQLSLLIADNRDDDSSYVALSYYADAEFKAYQGKYDEAIRTLDSIGIIFAFHAIDDDVLLLKYQIAMQQLDYRQADTLLGALYTKYPNSIYAHRALFLRAKLNEVELRDTNKAKELYLKIITTQPESLYLIEARKRYRKINQ